MHRAQSGSKQQPAVILTISQRGSVADGVRGDQNDTQVLLILVTQRIWSPVQERKWHVWISATVIHRTS